MMRSTTQFNILFSSYSILIVVLVILFFNFQLRIIKGDTKNFHISFDDYSITEENPSCRIIIDDSIVYTSDKISEFDAIDIVLKNGKHKFEVSDLCNNYCVKDSIIIKNYPEENNLYVSFEYNPSYEDYLPEFRKQYFDRFIEKHKNEYDKEQHSSIKEQINQQIDVAYLKRTSYKPIVRSFEITFYDEPIYLD